MFRPFDEFQRKSAHVPNGRCAKFNRRLMFGVLSRSLALRANVLYCFHGRTSGTPVRHGR